jgi:peptide/nickel transport system ATP-binding protein
MVSETFSTPVLGGETLTTMQDDALVEVKNLHLDFHTYAGEVKALDGVTFVVKKGEALGLVGESGCGKSVTALAIVGLLPENARITDGEILLSGENLLKMKPDEFRMIRANRIAMVFQDPTTFLNPVLTIGEQIEEVFLLNPERLSRIAAERNRTAAAKNEDNKEQSTNKAEKHQSTQLIVSKAEQRRLAKTLTIEVMKQVRLPDPERILGQYPHELSGGMRQRCMIAMALARDPDLFIADEITTALDVTIQAQILDLLRELKKEFLGVKGGSTLLITHDLGIVAELCERVAVMYAGNIVELADVKELFANPLHPYTQGLMRAIPMIDRRVEKLETIPGSVPDLIFPPTGCRFHPRCPFAFETCKLVKPELTDTGKHHTVACHLYGERKS